MAPFADCEGFLRLMTIITILFCSLGSSGARSVFFWWLKERISFFTGFLEIGVFFRVVGIWVLLGMSRYICVVILHLICIIYCE